MRRSVVFKEPNNNLFTKITKQMKSSISKTESNPLTSAKNAKGKIEAVKSNPFDATNQWPMDEYLVNDEEIIFENSGSNDDFFAPSPIMDSKEIKKRRLSKQFVIGRENLNVKNFNDVFNADILFITDQVKSNRIKDKADKESFGLFDIEADRNTFKKVNILRYRESVFRAAGRITHDLPPFPHWIYRDKVESKLERITFIVGGTQFQSFEDTIVHIPNTKLATCVIEKSGDPILFFDRDPACFNYILNFYRTGRLHAPSNACMSFFEEELEFWGINEEFMEPCCYSQYKAYKVACNTLKKFSESKDKSSFTKEKSKGLQNLRMQLYGAIVVGDKTIVSQWYSLFCATNIISAIMILFFGTSAFGRVDIKTQEYRKIGVNESLMQYFEETSIHSKLIEVEMVLAGYFMADILLRCLISPNRFVFFTDTINWIDLLATISSLISTITYDNNSSGFNEAYIIILKIPRIFRLFKLTPGLKSGMDAIILTIRASTDDLFLVFLIVVIFVSFFGVLIFVVELVNEVDAPSKFSSIYIGMWWAIVTMATVGYGDFIPNTQGGYVVGCACILFGIIICQLPVPIFLRNFSIYYNQAQSRLTHQTKVLTISVDPESIKEAQNKDQIGKGNDTLKMKRFSVAH